MPPIAPAEALPLLLSHWSTPYLNLPIFLSVRACSAEAKLRLLNDLFDIRVGAPFYPYDPHARWHPSYDCEVILNSIKAVGKSVAIPVSTPTVVNIFCYGEYSPAILAALQKDAIFKKPITYYWNSLPGQNPALEPYCHVYLQNFPKPSVPPVAAISEFKSLPFSQKQTLADLSGEGTSWAKFLCETLLEKKIISPVYCALAENKIVGIVGPLDIYTDVEGARFLAPVYFAVDENYRRQGLGRALRQAMSHFAATQGVDYKLHQAKADTPADKFYAQTGLTVVGKVSRFSQG